ncbi:hypothetical protein P691DRAFT_429135 [Macrolepiota fuliginosa MF-IS2]|uniref:Uncharacterized protein n=1 Tax=Macrolepiota fuliginosa MF-IS2 TaxID=1400762 RepID=A0A9P5XJE5_9AGAR|nr:hypothetical protein P691DRAFT_429135 [Macrolepiota fuliginosa MF-IS2]
MSDFSQSTLTSPRSPLFSDSDPPERQSGSEIVTSDEEPDLGAFTAVLRAWGYLQPPLRIPTHFPSSSSSRTRSTPTTITGYPGFGGGDSETVEESTVWNRIPIQSYFRHIYGTESSSGRTERARGSVLEELEDEELLSSPPPSPASEGARTVEIASEADAASVRSVTYEDGASGERLVVPIATPPSVDGRTVSVASGHESHDEQAPFTSRSSETPTSPMHPFNDNTVSSLSSVSPTFSQSNSVSNSNQPLDDNTTISRQRPYPSTLSIVSYQPQMSAVRTLSSVFQESPSPALLINSGPPFREITTSSPSATPLDPPQPSTRRVISNSSNAESDILNSYYTQVPAVVSPSTDQPASDYPWPRRLEIIAQPPSSSSHQPLLEQDDSPTARRQTPSIIDDNSSTSAVTEYTPPPSATTSAALSVLQEILSANAESSGVSSSHSLTPSHTIVFPTAPASTSTSTSTSVSTATTATANPTRQPSLESPIVYTRQHPSLASTYREQQSRTRTRIDTSIFQDMQTVSSQQQPRYHLLSPEGDPEYEQPSLGYLDEALSFIAAERARWTAAREAGLLRGPSPQRQEEEQSEESGACQEDETGGYAIVEYQKLSVLRSERSVYNNNSNNNSSLTTLPSFLQPPPQLPTKP